MRLAKEDVAKRIAISTNNKPTPTDGATQDAQVDTSAGERKLTWEPVAFKVGDFCRATYKEDGIDYEAVIVSASEGGRCLIRFLGYGNEQYNQMKELVASWGEEFRLEQIDAATTGNQSEEEVDSNASTLNSDRETTSGVDGGALGNRKRNRRGNRKANRLPMCPPMPPMPPSMNADDHLHAMLMAWYMSGYYTGVYDAQKSKQRKN